MTTSREHRPIRNLEFVTTRSNQSYDVHESGNKVYTIRRHPPPDGRWTAYDLQDRQVDIPDSHRYDLFERLKRTTEPALMENHSFSNAPNSD